MPIKVKYKFFVWIVLLPLNGFCQQKRNSLFVNEAKGYALCECIRIGYARADSTLAHKLKDYSGSYFVQKSNLSIDEMEKLSTYITDHLKKHSAIPSASGPSNSTANMVGYTCWKLYESKKLRAYINKLM